MHTRPVRPILTLACLGLLLTQFVLGAGCSYRSEATRLAGELEKRFIDRYNELILIQKLHTGSAEVGDLSIVTPGRGVRVSTAAIGKAFFSPSVWPFYGLLVFMLLIVGYWLLSAPHGRSGDRTGRNYSI